MGILAGRVALVTGASRGIGRAVAQSFAAEGAKVVAVARNADALNALASTISADGGDCRPAPLDMGDLRGIEKLAETLDAEFGRLDILIGNAGVFPGHFLVQDIPLDAMRETIHVNFLSNWYLLRCCHQLLNKSDAGRVVFVTAKGAYGGHPEWSAYAASKAALDRTMAAYASENEASAIRCNSLSPGPVITDMGVYANKGQPDDMAPAEALIPLFLYLVSPELRETGRMFDHRHFKGKQPIEPWQDIIVP